MALYISHCLNSLAYYTLFEFVSIIIECFILQYICSYEYIHVRIYKHIYICLHTYIFSEERKSLRYWITVALPSALSSFDSLRTTAIFIEQWWAPCSGHKIVGLYICMYIYMYVCICMFVCLCVCVYMYVCMYTCIHVCVFDVLDFQGCMYDVLM